MPSVAEDVSENEEIELEQKLSALREVLPQNRYFDIGICQESNEDAGTRGVFDGYWGASKEKGGRPVIFLADKTPRTAVGKELSDKGCGTENEIRVASRISLDEALDAHLVLPFDFYKVNGDSFSVAPKIEGAVTLKKYAQKNDFNFSDFKQFFNRVISGTRFFREKGFFHRDLLLIYK